MRIVEVAVALGAAGAFVATAALAHDAHPGGTSSAGADGSTARAEEDGGFWGAPSVESDDDGWFGGDDDEGDRGWFGGGDDDDGGGWFGGSSGTHES